MDLDAHVDYLARTYNMRRLDEREASFHLLMEAVTKGSLAPLVYCNSFSARHDKTGEMIFYVDPSESDNEIELYFIALHEIGHQVLGHMNGIEDIETIVENEIDAWRWAFEHSIIEPTDEVYMDMMNSLGTYTDDLYKVGAFRKENL